MPLNPWKWDHIAWEETAIEYRYRRRSDVGAFSKVIVTCSICKLPKLKTSVRSMKPSNGYRPVCKNCQQVPRVVPALVGFMAVEAQQLLALYVHPDYQQQGIGGCLLQLAKGYQSRLDVRVCALNIDAVQFYRRHGFHLLREVKDPLTGCDEVEMMYSKP